MAPPDPAPGRARPALLERLLDQLEAAPARIGSARAALAVVSPLGWTVMAVGVAAWVAGWQLGWRELMVLAACCLIVLLGGAVFVAGRAALRIDVELMPNRVVVGDPSTGNVRVANASGRRTLAVQVELPVRADASGPAGGVVFDVPSLAPGAYTDEAFVLPTHRRGVVAVGPARSVRSDPLGLFHREAASSPAYELVVHPRTVALAPFGSGLLRDLEGLTTKDLSVSDLAFHALREYAPGDDRRHVHWRSTARTGRLLVRQFQDTRRSTLCIVVDGRPEHWGDADEFELGMQVAGSVALRACRDELPATLVAAGQVARGVVPHVHLDALARAEVGERTPELPELIQRAMARSGDISFGLIVSGSTATPEQLQRAALRFPVDVRVIALRIEPGSAPGLRPGSRAVVAQIGALEELATLLATEVAA